MHSTLSIGKHTMEDLPPGFRFYPTEEELVNFYLRNKLDGTRENLNQLMDRIIPVLDIYEFNPWQLPQFAGEFSNSDPEQCFFFIPRQESEARGGRPRRLTTAGYWKATGSPGRVYSNNRCIGMKRTMVFYIGRAPSGRKTEWKMNEYKAIQEASSSSSSSSGATTLPTLRQEFSLCRVYKKSNSLRAFDRRPQVEIGEIRAQPQQHPGNETTTTTTITAPNNQSANAMVVDKTGSSPESSSSGDPGNNPSQNHGESSNMSMSIDSEPSWDLEPLEWYYDGEDLLFK